MKKMTAALISIVFTCGFVDQKAIADEINAAVAANFATTFKKIASIYEVETGHRVNRIIGSTGKLTAQIIQGAPFDIFLAADKDRPAFLVEEGLADADDRETYARGRLVFWYKGSGGSGFKTAEERLKSGKINRIAIANPRLAPYGGAALATLRALGLEEGYRDRLILGESVGQVFGYIENGAVPSGFVALSQIISLPLGRIEESDIWLVPPELHFPVDQDMVLLERSRENRAVRGLFNLIQSERMRQIIRRDGYIVFGG